MDWAHCDYCNRWVHLNSECSRNAIIGDDAFMCALCREDNEGGRAVAVIEKTTASPMKIDDEEALLTSTIHFEASTQESPVSIPEGV